MTNKIVVRVRELPPSLQSALESVGYGRKDVAIVVAEEEEIPSAYGDGYQAFAVGVNVSTGVRTYHEGSWGGANMFTQKIVDQHPTVQLPVGAALITGQRGGGRPVSARITVAPGTLAPNLLAPVSDVTEREQGILAIFGGLKSFARKEYLDRMGATEAEVTALVTRGFLKRASNGATQITTEGKNAAGDRKVY